MREALRAQVQALGEAGAAGALLFTCNGRGSHMFEIPDHDAPRWRTRSASPRRASSAPARSGRLAARNFLHGFTATMAVFPAA